MSYRHSNKNLMPPLFLQNPYARQRRARRIESRLVRAINALTPVAWAVCAGLGLGLAWLLCVWMQRGF